TYHIVNIKSLQITYTLRVLPVFTYHLVNIKLMSEADKRAYESHFTYHIVNITLTYIISFFNKQST
ncbi:hypothetical protein, partial [Clostridioides difficile]|uniref:hypothetical protein n=1 Tax=Clostridioides difficile TaxID=1496 RepID=UPI0009A2F8BE